MSVTVDDLEAVDQPPINVPYYVEGWSCPHCRAGVEWYVALGMIARIHTSDDCPAWRSLPPELRLSHREAG